MVARSASDIPVLLDPGLYSPEFWQDYYAQVVTQDDEPVDGPITEKQMRLLTHPLYTSWRTDRPFVAHANVGLFYEPKRPPVVPDIMVVLDVRSLPFDEGKKAHAYFLWEYRKVPEVAIEVVSNDEGEEDGRKKNIYAASAFRTTSSSIRKSGSARRCCGPTNFAAASTSRCPSRGFPP